MMQPRMRTSCAAPGFTLIELSIVVAIAAVIAAVATPSFVDYLRRGKIVEAVTRLSDYRVRMEQYFLDNRRYDDGAGNCGVLLPAETAADSFNVACAAGTNAYILTATGVATKGMRGFVYTVDDAETHRTPSVPDGWITSDQCWVVRRDGSCI